jgi:hypothetical protein
MSAMNPPQSQDPWVPTPTNQPATGPAAGPAPGGMGYPPLPGHPGASPYHGPDPRAQVVPARPGTVLAGVIMTFLGSASLIILGVFLAVASMVPDFVRGFADGFGSPVQASSLAVVGLVFVVIGAGLVTLAAFVLRGRNGARIALTVVGGLVVITMGALATAVTEILFVVWIATALGLVWCRSANGWYRNLGA